MIIEKMGIRINQTILLQFYNITLYQSVFKFFRVGSIVFDDVQYKRTDSGTYTARESVFICEKFSCFC